MMNEVNQPLGVNEKDPQYHVQKVRKNLRDLSAHLRDDIAKIEEPQAKAMFETAAEVLEALAKTFDHYEQKQENAFRA